MEQVNRMSGGWLNSEEEKLQEKIYQSRLLLVYGDLLTDTVKRSCELVIGQDLTAAEAGEKIGCSRQAVGQNVQRGLDLMENYEDNLDILHFKDSMMEQLKLLQSSIGRLDITQANRILDMIIQNFQNYLENDSCP